MNTRGRRKKSPENENAVKLKKNVAKPKKTQNAKSKRQKEVTIADEANISLSDEMSGKLSSETHRNSKGIFLRKQTLVGFTF